MANPFKLFEEFSNLISGTSKVAEFNPKLGAKVTATPSGGAEIHDHQGNKVGTFKTQQEADKFYWDAWDKTGGLVAPPAAKPPAPAAAPAAAPAGPPMLMPGPPGSPASSEKSLDEMMAELNEIINGPTMKPAAKTIPITTPKPVVGSPSGTGEVPLGKKTAQTAFVPGGKTPLDQSLKNIAEALASKPPSGMPASSARTNIPSEAVRQDRAARAGFTTTAFKGGHEESPRDFGKLTPTEGGFFSAGDPKLANQYAGSAISQGSVTPLLLNTQDYLVFNAGGKTYHDVNRQVIRQAQKEGKKGVVVVNVLDHPAGKEPLPGHPYLGPQTVYITIDPRTMRSKFAAFDPGKKNLSDLLASGAALVVPAATAALFGGTGEAKAAEESPAARSADTTGANLDPAALDQIIAGSGGDRTDKPGTSTVEPAKDSPAAASPYGRMWGPSLPPFTGKEDAPASRTAGEMLRSYPGAVKDIVRESYDRSWQPSLPSTPGEEPSALHKAADYAGRPLNAMMEFMNILSAPAQAIPRAATGEESPVLESLFGMAAPLGGVGAAAKGIAKGVSKLPAAAGPARSFINQISDELHQLRTTRTSDEAEMLERQRTMPKEFKAPGVQEQVYHKLEEGGTMPPAVDALTKQHIQPMREELDQLYSTAKGLKMPPSAAGMFDPNYMHRQAKGYWRSYDQPGTHPDPLFSGSPKGLPRTTAALQEPKYHTLVEQGTGRRLVVSESPHGTIEFWHGPPAGGGKHAPYDTKVAGPIEDGQAYTIAGKPFIAERSRTREIEAATPTKYHKNAFVNTADALIRMREVVRNQKYLDTLKQTPTFQSWATTNKKEAFKRGWKESKLPQLEGTYLHPKLRAAFDDFVHPGTGIDEWLGGLAKVNHFATGSIFWNPTPHWENVMGHWAVGRGFDWIKPQGWKSLALDSAKAIKAVTTQDDNYRRLLKEGSSLIFGPTRNRSMVNGDFYTLLAKKAGMEIEANPERWGKVMSTLGLNKPADLTNALYTGMRRALWWGNDVMMMQRVLELERKGMSTARAIKEAEKHIPNYRIPTEVLGSRAFSQFLQDPNITMFGRYHYGMWNSYANMVRDLLKGTKEERLESIGNMLALGLLSFGVYPAINYGISQLTGSDDIKKIPRGPAAVPTALAGSAGLKFNQPLIPTWDQGDSAPFNQLIANSMILAPLPKASIEQITNTDLYTHQPIAEPGQPAGEQIADRADKLGQDFVSPYQLLSRGSDESAHSPGRIALDQLLGLQDPTDRQLHGKQIGQKIERRRTRKREQRPRGPLERMYQGVTE